MAALPDNGGQRMRAEPLGSLLVSRGHITEEQLELALTEQKATGRPLGEIVVTRGFAAAPTVAQALATQHGGLLKTEYGFATGWGGQENSLARVPRPEPEPRNEEVEKLQALLDEHRTALEAWKQSHAKLEEKLAQAQQTAAPADTSVLVQLGAEREALQAELAERDAAIVKLEARLLEAQTPAPPVADPRLEQLETELSARDASIAELEARLAESQQPVPALDDPRLEQLQSELETRDVSIAGLEARLAEAQQPAPPVADPRLEQLEAELAARDLSIEQLQGASESRRLELEERFAALEAERASAIAELEQQLIAAQQPAPPVDDPRLARLEAERVSMQAELAARDAAIEQLQASRAIVETDRAELEQALASEVEQAATLRAEVMAVGASESARIELEERLAALEADRDGLRAELAARDASIGQLEASRAAVEAGRAELERALAHEAEQAAALRAEVAAIGATAAQREEFEERLTALGTEAAERLTVAAAEFESAREGLDRQLAAAHERAVALEAELARRDADIEAIQAAPAPAPVGRWDAAESHLIFFQGHDGYELIERPGPPPSEGSNVGTQIVARISSAPIPGSKLPCAYLVA